MLARFLKILAQPVAIAPSRKLSNIATKPLNMGSFYPANKSETASSSYVKGHGLYVNSSVCLEDSLSPVFVQSEKRKSADLFEVDENEVAERKLQIEQEVSTSRRKP